MNSLTCSNFPAARLATACSIALGLLFIMALMLPTQLQAAELPVCALPERLDPVFASRFEPGAENGELALDEPGPFSVLTQAGQTVRDGRTTPWVAYLPDGAELPALVLFAPGFQIPSAAYRDWVEHLASWGIIAVRADPPGGLFTVSHVAMTLDLRAVLDDLLLPGTLAMAPDPERIVTAGHSLGGKLAVMVADSDERVAAVFTLDPVNGGGPGGYTPERPNIVPGSVENLDIPLGFVGELLDGTGGPFGACAPLAQNYQTFFEAADASPSAYEWTLDGAAHNDFVTNPDSCGLPCSLCSTGTLDTEVTHAFMRAAGVAFIRAHLDGDTDNCTWLTGQRVPPAVSIRQSP